MNRIGNQRQRVRGIAKNQLRDHEHRVERDARSERKSEMIRRVAVPGMAVRMAMSVPVVVSMGMVMMVVLMGHGA